MLIFARNNTTTQPNPEAFSTHKEDLILRLALDQIWTLPRAVTSSPFPRLRANNRTREDA